MTTFLEETNKELNSLLWKMTEPTEKGSVPMSPKTMEVLRDFIASRLTLQRKEIEKKSLEVLEEHFPKQNQKDVRFPSPNGRGAVMAYRALLINALDGAYPPHSKIKVLK